MRKRIVLTLCRPDVIELVERLPRGYRSLVFEAALLAYMRSDTGSDILASVEARKDLKKGRSKKKLSTNHQKQDLLERLKGDFD
jgi:hypothetical protein